MCAYVQILSLKQPELLSVIQFTDQWANKLIYNADNSYNIMEVGHLSLAELYISKDK